MLPEAPLLLEPLENPPPYPPPLALAKDTVGTPIREITIIAAMSFVVFKISFLSIDVADQSSSTILTEAFPRKPNIRGLRVLRCDVRPTNEALPILYTSLYKKGTWLLPPHPSETARCTSTGEHLVCPLLPHPFLSALDDMMGAIPQNEFHIHTFERESWP
jgi:hypothetical protein